MNERKWFVLVGNCAVGVSSWRDLKPRLNRVILIFVKLSSVKILLNYNDNKYNKI